MCCIERERRELALIAAVIFFVMASPQVYKQVKQLTGSLPVMQRVGVNAALMGCALYVVMKFKKCSCPECKPSPEEEEKQQLEQQAEKTAAGGLFNTKESCGCPAGQ